jgi:hypothetical protein
LCGGVVCGEGHGDGHAAAVRVGGTAGVTLQLSKQGTKEKKGTIRSRSTDVG